MSVGPVILRVAVGAKFVATGLRSSLAGSVATDSSMPLFESTSRMGSGTRMVASSFRGRTRTPQAGAYGWMLTDGAS
jgi:hypothetical protein